MIRQQDHHQGPASSAEPDGVSLNGPGALRLQDHRMLTIHEFVSGRFLAVLSGFGHQVSVVPAWRVDEGVIVSLAA